MACLLSVLHDTMSSLLDYFDIYILPCQNLQVSPSLDNHTSDLLRTASQSSMWQIANMMTNILGGKDFTDQ